MSKPASAEGSASGITRKNASFADVHESWRFRLAPPPGYASLPDLRPMRSWDFPPDVADAAPEAPALDTKVPPAPTGKVKKGKKAKLSKLSVAPAADGHGTRSLGQISSPLIAKAVGSAMQRTQSRVSSPSHSWISFLTALPGRRPFSAIPYGSQIRRIRR